VCATSKNAHLTARFTKGYRTDKFPVLQDRGSSAIKRGWSKHAIKSIYVEKWSVGHFWKTGYCQKDGEAFGNAQDYSKFWFEHERCMLQKKKMRHVSLDRNNMLDEVVHFWYGNHDYIRKKHIPRKKSLRNNGGMSSGHTTCICLFPNHS
jgi:hypothetical protein